VIIPSARRDVPLACALVALLLGTIAALHYHRIGLTLAHYDARGHLVVARRIFDSITPGWQQLGAVWLPLPHVLNAVPVQVDLFYRTGASAVAISIASFAIADAAIASIVLALTGSSAAAVAAAAVFAFNPNVMYLQSTPMTEPLLLALVMASVAMLIAWCEDHSADLKVCTTSEMVTRDHQTDLHAYARTDPPTGVVQAFRPAASVVQAFRPAASVVRAFRPAVSTAEALSAGVSTRGAGSVLALACMARYEAWPVTYCALAAALWTLWRSGEPIAASARRVGAVALYPALAIAGFAIFSRVVIGEWFVASGFFVPENKALDDPVLAAAEIWWGTRTLSGPLLIAIGAAGAMLLLVAGAASRRHAAWLIALSPLAMALIPWAAFVKGHPFRIRYAVPLIALQAVAAGVLAGASRRARALASLAVLTVVAIELHPLDPSAPMAIEAQWDRPNVPARARVTACLGTPAYGKKIMASMGSLGHYMQEASAAGFTIRDFLHEGNGDIWLAALEGPQPYVEWILIEEKAEGGDMLARRAREHPGFLHGYSRVCEGAGLVLYRRN
jgi:hypothetical protein